MPAAELPPLRTRLRAWADELREDAWIVVFVSVALTAMLAALGRPEPGELARTFAFNATMMVLVELIASGLFVLVVAPRTAGRAPALRWAARVGVVAVAVVVAAELTLRLYAAIGWVADLAASRTQVLRISAVVSVTLFVTAAALERIHERRRALERREEQLRREALRAQLAALQARTNPHFLFNALNTVASLIEDDPALAEQAVERLAGLFRYSLDGSRTLAVPLRDELAAVRDYVEVERLRFGERLRVEFAVEPATESLVVPPLVLQPLVENAVGHGVAASRGGATVRIVAARVGASLELTVEDDAAATGRANRSGSGTALADLRERLRLAYGAAAGLEAGPRAEGGFRARLRLPAGAARGEGAA
ncbi:sensor histidine kinase [Nannocystis bainbridge]|uniref:Histidine kinase n=1 Tax=Nannocystis bainbridge TaxID=2995303 RepID=A0ABT5E8I3_9BACT|nr:histidine kinase [Nannocystis bainbridge]MDC0721753.1 histidine kinase [Nannocystis bainbridge]